MSEELRKVLVKMEAETARYQRDLDKSRRETSKWRKKAERDVRDVGKVFRNLAIAGGIGLLTKKVIEASSTQERAVRQLEQGWKSTAGVVGLTVEQMTQHAADLQKTSLFGDEQIIEAQSKLITFTNIADEQFKKATVAALDMSSRMGTDLSSAVVQIGKVLNDPVANLSALNRVGIQFSDTQEDLIKGLAKSGDLMGAQNVILKEMERQFGGSAAAARDTFGGAVSGLSNAFADLWEAGDGLDEAKEAVEELTGLLQDPDTISAANTLTSALVSGFKNVAKVITGAVNVARWAGEELSAVINGPALDDVVRIEQAIERQQQKVDLWRSRYQATGAVGAKGELDLAVQKMDQLNARLDKAVQLRDMLDNMGGGSKAPPELPAGSADTPTDSPVGATDAKLTALLERQKQFYQSAQEENLQSFGEEARLEELRYARQKEQFENGIQALRDKNVATDELEAQHRDAMLLAEESHQLKLIEIRNKSAEKQKAIDLERKEFQQRVGAELLTFTSQQLSITTDMLAQSGKENSALYKALFLVQKAAAIPSMIIATEEASTKALAAFPPPVGPALSAAVRTMGYASVGIAAGQAVAGIAHGGMTNIPRESTYLLDKGERVLSPNQNSDLTRFLQSDRGRQAGQFSSLSIYINGVEQQADSDTIRDRAREVLIEDVSNKASKFHRALQSQTNVRPKGKY